MKGTDKVDDLQTVIQSAIENQRNFALNHLALCDAKLQLITKELLSAKERISDLEAEKLRSVASNGG